MSVDKPTILCVDDDELILNSLKIQIKQNLQGACFVETALSAQDALEYLEEMAELGSRVIIVISDWIMPGMKGDEFLMKVHSYYPDTVKIMLTGQVEPSAVERSMKYAGLRQCIQKPWNCEELMGLLKAEIEKR